eukprot:scpid45343/ scgid24080/ 
MAPCKHMKLTGLELPPGKFERIKIKEPHEQHMEQRAQPQQKCTPKAPVAQFQQAGLRFCFTQTQINHAKSMCLTVSLRVFVCWPCFGFRFLRTASVYGVRRRDTQ